MTRTTLLLATILLLPLSTSGQTPEEKGIEIAREAERRDEGFIDYTAAMRMILKNRHGEESIREIRVQVLEVKDDGDKSLSLFDSPKDVKGTAFLTHSHKEGDDDQWLYLPALKRVKRINSRNKSGSYMGSEFAYEDIASQEVEKYTYKWLRDERYNEMDCFVVERYPKDTNSGYVRQVVWLDKEHYRAWKVEYFDRKESLLKTLTINVYKQYAGRYWRPDAMHMENHQNGKSTDLFWSDYRFQAGLNEKDFEMNALDRVR